MLVNEYLRIMDFMVENGAEIIILGSIEIGLLVKDYKTELFESSLIHAHTAVRKCLEKDV